jgi:hypothetical protein
MPVPHLPLSPLVRLAEQVVLAAFPHGGQQRARRNAWSAMAGDAARARSRREAAAALRSAVETAQARAVPEARTAQG